MDSHWRDSLVQASARYLELFWLARGRQRLLATPAYTCELLLGLSQRMVRGTRE